MVEKDIQVPPNISKLGDFQHVKTKYSTSDGKHYQDDKLSLFILPGLLTHGSLSGSTIKPKQYAQHNVEYQ